jgi:membrane fusion protein (multidrug efflux system)
MRASLVALFALAAVAAGAYAGMNSMLPAPAQRGFDGALAAVSSASRNDASARPVPAAAKEARRIPVEAAKATAETVSPRFSSIGTLISEESVQIAAEQPGRLTAVRFKEGERVGENDPIIKFDDSLLRAELRDAEARLTLAEANFKRANSLSQSGYATQTARDQAIADRATASATVELAKVRLGKTEIRAPFGGVVGFRLSSVGAYVQAGQPIVNLENIDTLKVDFRVPEARLADVKVGLDVKVIVDAHPGRAFYGRIYAIDPLVDVNGRALKVRARLDNADGALRPGLFARVEVSGDSSQNVVLIPESALMPRGAENLVYLIQDGKAVQKPVRLGQRRAGIVEVVQGVGAGEMVVTAGQPRLQDGASVEVVEAAAQVSAATPH